MRERSVPAHQECPPAPRNSPLCNGSTVAEALATGCTMAARAAGDEEFLEGTSLFLEFRGCRKSAASRRSGGAAVQVHRTASHERSPPPRLRSDSRDCSLPFRSTQFTGDTPRGDIPGTFLFRVVC